MKTVALLHGWGLGAAVFDALAARLAPHYAVRAFGLPGYDGTPACEPYTLDRLAQACAARAPAECLVVGWSLGAQVALAWAQAAPRQVERLALIGATPCFVQREGWTHGVESAVFRGFAEALSRDRAGTLARFISLQAQGDAALRRVSTDLRKALSARAAPEIEVLERGLQLLEHNDLRERLCAIAQRALVVHGGEDRLAPLAAARALAQALPLARLAVIEGAAHAPFISDAGRVSRLLEAFFDER